MRFVASLREEAFLWSGIIFIPECLVPTIVTNSDWAQWEGMVNWMKFNIRWFLCLLNINGVVSFSNAIQSFLLCTLNCPFQRQSQNSHEDSFGSLPTIGVSGCVYNGQDVYCILYFTPLGGCHGTRYTRYKSIFCLSLKWSQGLSKEHWTKSGSHSWCH